MSHLNIKIESDSLGVLSEAFFQSYSGLPNIPIRNGLFFPDDWMEEFLYLLVAGGEGKDRGEDVGIMGGSLKVFKRDI